MTDSASNNLISLEINRPIWDHFFKASSLVLIGTRDKSGDYNQAAKHMAIPMGWENYFGFVCTPDHTTYHNIIRENVFTVTYPRPIEIIFSSLAAAPRTDDIFKSSLTSLPAFKAGSIEGRFVSCGYAFLECKHHKIVDGFGKNSLITGEIVAAKVHEDALPLCEGDDDQLIRKSPVMEYLEPGRFTRIETSYSYPLPKDFSRRLSVIS